jgi:S-adenosylmethionine:tRNA ribosyltransferase-isomerase
MSPATWPRDNPQEERLLRIEPARERFIDARIADLPAMLHEGDLVVVNDGATLPGSFHGVTAAGAPVEVRLCQALAEGRFSALLFGAGDWRTRTEDRPAPPPLAPGDTVRFGEDLSAVIERHSAASARLVEIAFHERGARLWEALYRWGRPVQYAYLKAPLKLWHTQTRFAARPWCAELASAGRPLSWRLLLDLTRRGVRIASLTHAAGLSSTGDPALDALLPLPERFEIPEATVTAVREAKARGGRVIAVGTTVTRALEGCAAAHDAGAPPRRSPSHRGWIAHRDARPHREPFPAPRGLRAAFAAPPRPHPR